MKGMGMTVYFDQYNPGSEKATDARKSLASLDYSPLPRLTWRSLSMGALVSMGGLIFGYDTGQISGFLEMPDFKERFAQRQPDGTYVFSNVRSGLIVALLSIGTLIGALVAAPLADKLGRKYSISIWSVVVSVGFIIQIASINAWYQVMIGRLVAGWGVGALSVLVPMYQAETAPAWIRGALVCTYQLFITLGIFLAACFNYGTYEHQRYNSGSWRIVIGLGWVWTIVLGVGILFFDETPRYAYRQGRVEEAKQTLMKVYGAPAHHYAIHTQMEEIESKFRAEAQANPNPVKELVEMFKAPRMAYRIGLGVMLQMFQQLTGANFFFYYGTTIFQSVNISSFITQMILNGVNFGTTFIGLYMVERFGRRKSLIGGSIGMFICFLIFASVGHFALDRTTPSNTPQAGIAMIVFACLFILSYATTWGPMVWTIIAELYPSRYRAKGIAIATASNWTWNFLIAFFTPFIISAIDFRYGYVFAGCNFLAGVLVYLFVIEGQGRTLEEIDTMYIEHVSPRKSAKWIAPSASEIARLRREAGTEVAEPVNGERGIYSGETERGLNGGGVTKDDQQDEHAENVTHARTRLHLQNIRTQHIPYFRFEYLPQFKHRAQSRIWQAILRHERRKRVRRTEGRGIREFIRRASIGAGSRVLRVWRGQKAVGVRRRDIAPLPPKEGKRHVHGDMGSSYNSYGGGRYNYDDNVPSGYGERVPGARRQKMMGYLRAANELRQSYQNSVSQRYLADGDATVPGAFPEMDVVRTGDEEMLLFPSYARKHIKRKRSEQQLTAAGNGYAGNVPVTGSYGDSGDADYWRREWEKHEDENAVVDVDVRGWIYSPQKGPLTRRNRLILTVARKLSGIPAPDQSPGGSRESSQHPSFRAKVHDRMMSREEEAAVREANYIEQRGQKEADAAAQGAYLTSSRASQSPGDSRSTSPSSSSRIGDDEVINKRQSWSLQTNEMSREELLRANEQLMTRLRPFMTLPVADAPITVFFFNDDKSQSKSVTTDESGHFNLRAALDFVPSKVRVLASENLSAMEDVLVTDSQGISLVSDIDDTIKHSAIASGAKEIFKNTFIRDLNDLTISGVKEWYDAVADMGVKLHYVSNSPWQLYPLLKSFFKMTGLPSGSIHLKQYSGMLQGIFEPAAERKRGSLERIMHDFPERKFILVGDSGEADLEVYTDVVVANPGRVLGVYIRDVTTSENSQYADSVIDSGAEAFSQSDQPEARPSLPARPKAASVSKVQEVEKDLIDFSDEPEPSDLKRSQTSGSHFDDIGRSLPQERGNKGAPNKPAKPSNLRSFSTTPQQNPSPALSGSTVNQNSSETKRTAPPPPKPRKASTFNYTTSTGGTSTQRPPISPHQVQQQTQRPVAPPRTPSTATLSSTYSGLSSYSSRDDDGYVASARRHLATAYNALPQIRTPSPARDNMPDLGPRRGLSSYPAAAARWATGASYGDTAGGDATSNAMYNKKEEMWKRRWARSEEIMRRNGVVLRSWRIGSDVMEECIELIRKTESKLRQ